MYNLPYHKEQDEAVVREFLLQHPFAFLSGCDAQQQPVATQVPLLYKEIDGQKVLWGHIMKNTDHHKAFEQNPNVLAVFSGKHSYVSGSWYSNPHMASTWNYMSVHVRGKIRFLANERLEEMLRITSLHFEQNDPQSPTVYDNLPETFRKKVLKAIIAFQIDIEAIDTVFKLSQDRDAESYDNIIAKLKMQDEDGRFIAEEMQKRKEQLFPNRSKATILFDRS